MRDIVLLGVMQLALTIAAGTGLWRLWTWVRGTTPQLAVVVGSGFVLRAILAQALFWISWFHLPIGQALQLGGGFWFFAADADDYLLAAERVLRQTGLFFIFSAHTYPAFSFVRIVTAGVAAFGNVAAIAIILNCAAYLATCILIIRLAGAQRRTNAPMVIALSAVAFGPATILWSLQLLKETVWMFFAAAFFLACRSWQDSWNSHAATSSRCRALTAAIAMLGCTYVLAGIRWYFALIAWIASAAFFGLVVARTHQRRAVIGASVVLFVLLGQAVRLGGDTDIPIDVRRYLNPSSWRTPSLKPAATAAGYVQVIRSGFDGTVAATAIVPGPILAAVNWPTPMLPQTIAGLAALGLPRTVGEALGLVQIGGGRGLWLFAEIDTVVFALVLIFAAVYTARMLASSRSAATPLAMLLLLVFVVLTPLLAYTVNNFGTLFRLRQMIYLVAVLLPLSLVDKR